ncbi:hypothetical protein TI39_contig4342g00005 [Zymoseptoria brevis]|uniref:Uncharacterized protein n=1 Tax=Zymoseptoria brevis TaxID=1047168 RepID=A0A0F4G8D8_9PEZI|nr:hypothetical protein TI39_contig4342g00005 [Zymoseptoria brevis]
MEFIVTTNNPKNDTKGKKRVRSIAALKGWPERRRRAFEHLEDREARVARKSDDRTQLQSSLAIVRRAVPSLLDHPRPPPIVVPSEHGSDEGFQSIDNCNEPGTEDDYEALVSFGTLYNRVLQHLPRALLAPPEQSTSLDNTSCSCTACRDARRPAGGFAADISQTLRTSGRLRMFQKESRCIRQLAVQSPPQSPSAGMVDPFNCSPVHYHPWYDQIMHHMMVIYAPLGWAPLKLTNDQGFEWEWYMTQTALAEPALFYVHLLFGAGVLVQLGTIPLTYTGYLHAKSVRAIQEGLQDPKRATSDANILAVGRLALYEHLFGDRRAARNIHRPAQRRMIDLRGGMKDLTVPDFLRPMMRGCDVLMAVGSDNVLFLEDDNVPNFSARETFGAAAHWAPHEMVCIRKVKFCIANIGGASLI